MALNNFVQQALAMEWVVHDEVIDFSKENVIVEVAYQIAHDTITVAIFLIDLIPVEDSIVSVVKIDHFIA